MKIVIPVVQEQEITHVSIEAAVNYDEEEIPNNFPGRKGDLWRAVIDIDTGKIRDWPQGRAEKMHLTVKDCGRYALLDASGKEVLMREDDYVPNGVIPGKYGDTIELDIDATGAVTNWPQEPDVSSFQGD